MNVRETFEQYVSDVISKRKLTGELERLACERHVRDMERTDGLWWFDWEQAERVVKFCYMCKHWKGEWAGKPFIPEPFQVFTMCSILSWKSTTTGLRRFNLVYEELPRKNGKTFKAAVIGLYLFAADGEPGAEVYTAATKKDQARIAHKDAKNIVKRSPLLSKSSEVQRDIIFNEVTGNRYEPLGRDAGTLDGLNVHGAVIDEYHAHPSAELFSVLFDATGARSQPLIFIITTAGFLLHGPCKQRRDLGEKILRRTDGFEDDRQFVFIACPDENDDWGDEKTWRKANPNYGVSVNPDDMRRAYRDAENLPTLQNNFMTKRLNVWVGQSERWLSMEDWKKCDEQSIGDLKGREAFGGLDLSSTSDITACVWVLPDPDGWFFDVVARFWVPVDSARERERKDKVPYTAWAKAGYIELTDGNVIDFDHVRARINADHDLMSVRDLAFDPWAATQMSNELQSDGVEVVEFRQGYKSMNEPAHALERFVKQGRLRVGNNPVLSWMVDNVSIDTDPAGSIKPSKTKSSEKIDGVVALIMAVGRATLSEVDAPSVYETRGVLTLD